MTRLIGWARSPRTAIALILALSLYAAAVTAVPQASLTPEKHAEWVASGSLSARVLSSLRFDRAYTNPVFLAIALALAFSTGVCSADRTRRAVRLWRARGTVDEPLARRLREAKPVAVFDDEEVARATVAEAVAGERLTLRAGERVAYAERGALGLAGSPVFHWSLVALMVVVALGFLTRWEGLIGVPQGVGTRDVAANYGRLDAGPLALPHTGYTLSIAEIRDDYRVGSVHYGFVPTVSVYDGEKLLASSMVHANRPLRVGPLLIHLSDHGLAATFELREPGGAVVDTTTRIFDFDEASPSGTTASGFDVSGVASITVEIDARDSTGALPRLLPPRAPVIVTVEGADGGVERVVRHAGEAVDLADGQTLHVKEVGYYARLSVVRDWSVPWIYALLVVSTLALAVAMLVPYRSVWIRTSPTDDGRVGVAVVAGAGRHSAELGDAIRRRLRGEHGVAKTDDQKTDGGEGRS